MIEGEPSVEGFHSLQRLAQGGFSTVFSAHQEQFDRTVALKVIFADLRDSRAARRFARECKATGRLTDHPNIITIYDAGATSDGRPFIAMQYLPRGSVADRLRREGTLRTADALRLAATTAEALHAAHGAGIIHRDVKPGNILLTQNDEPVLSDFGIASLTTGPDLSTTTDAFTLHYSAPEILSGEEPNVRSDVYALGATLYTMLAGRPPFGARPGDNPASVLRRILSEQPPPLGRDDVPDEVVDLLRATLARDAADRPGTPGALADDLRRLSERPSVTGPRTPPKPAGTPPARDAAGVLDDVDDLHAVDDLDDLGDLGGRADLGGLEDLREADPVPDRTRERERSPRPAPAPKKSRKARERKAGDPWEPPAERPGPLGRPDRSGYDPSGLNVPTRERSRSLAEPEPNHPPAGLDTAEPLNARPRNRVLVGVGIGVAALLAVLVLAAFLAPRPAAKGASGASGTAPVTAATPGAADIARARPSGLQAADHGASVLLTWRNSATAAKAPIFIAVRSNNIAVPGYTAAPGATVFDVDGLEPTAPYCFRVGALLALVGQTSFTAWSDWTCIRGDSVPTAA